MIDLILTDLSEGPATLFTRNFRVYSGIPIGLYEDGPRAPLAMVYGDISTESLLEISRNYLAIVAIPSSKNDNIPEKPCHYETMTVKAPILAEVHQIERIGFSGFVRTFEGGPLVLQGSTAGVPTLIFTADLIRATIRILSGELEKTGETDHRGRHIPPSENVTATPAVSLHFNLIANAVRYLYKGLELPLFSIPRWPGGAPMAVFVSHDVDSVRKWTKKRSAYELFMGVKDMFHLKTGHFKETYKSIKEAWKGNDPEWMFDELMFIESTNGFDGTWFFAPFWEEFKKREKPDDPIYRRRASEVSAIIRRLKEHGCEIALHGVRDAHIKAKSLTRQLTMFEKRLGLKLNGVRQHYLMFSHDATFEATVQSGLEWDSTLGLSDRAGYRNGMASPFFPNPSSHPVGKIVEIPLVFMDSMFFHTADGVEATTRKVIEAYLYARAAGGMFSVLIHPGNMDRLAIPELNRFYLSLISRFRMDKACSMTGTGLARWWKKREEVLKNLEYGPEGWRIQGVDIPENMLFNLSMPGIEKMKFSIEGTTARSTINEDTVTISPGKIDSSAGITILKRK